MATTHATPEVRWTWSTSQDIQGVVGLVTDTKPASLLGRWVDIL